MVLGVATVRLRIPGSRSLKDRRNAVRSIVERIRARFNVSVLDVGSQDVHNFAAVAVAVVASESSFAHEVLSKAVEVIHRDGRVVVDSVDTSVEGRGDGGLP